MQFTGARRAQRWNTAKQFIRPVSEVDNDTTDTGNAVLNFMHVSADPPDDALVHPSQLRSSVDQTNNTETDARRPTQSKSRSFSGADVSRSRTTITGKPAAENADDDTGKRRSVSKTGTMNENRKREQNDVLRRQTVTANGGLWPVDHKDVSNMYNSTI